MNNAAQNIVPQGDDEEGVANEAAGLGADGNPLVNVSSDAEAFDSDLDDILEDDESWLDEELTEEELEALGEEDFSDNDFSEADFTEDDFSDEPVSVDENDLAYAGAEIDEAAIDEFDDANDFSLDEEEFGDVVSTDEALLAAEDVGSLEEDVAVATGPSALVASADALPSVGDVGGELTDFGEEEVDHRPVPRISIHAFCETQEVSGLLERAAVDRRLSKTHLTIHMGGVSKAVDQFQSASTPNLIILETAAGGLDIFAQLGQLAEVCDPSTKVVIIGQVNDIVLYRELIKQGISEYIVRPNSPLQIIKTIADLYVDPSAPPIGRTIAFVGARGGAGSSTIAHNVGWCTAEEYKSDTVILDLDLPFGTASLDFDQEASAGLVEALTSPERLDDVLLERLLQKHTDHLSLFTAPSMLDRDFVDLDDQAFESVIDIVRGVAPTIVVDVPHIWTNWSKRILTSADEIVVVATPDYASFRNAKNLIDILNGARPNDSAPKLILNMFDPKAPVIQPDQYAEHVGIEPTHVFNWEPQLFATAATNVSPITEVNAKSKTAQGLIDLSGQLLGRSEAKTKKPKFSLADLFSRKR